MKKKLSTTLFLEGKVPYRKKEKKKKKKEKEKIKINFFTVYTINTNYYLKYL